MKYVVEEYKFRIAYNLDSIRKVEHGFAKTICGSVSNAIQEGHDPYDKLLRIYFKDGDWATFDFDRIDVYLEKEDDKHDATSI